MIRKITLFSLMFLGCMALRAQSTPAFSENFTGTTDQTGLGSLTDLGWTIYDEDGQTVNPQISFIDEAWKIVYFSDIGEAMVTTSYFTTTGQQADRWAVTPQISVPATNPTLLFQVLSGDPNAPEAYEVLVSTTGNTPADFTDAAVLTDDPAPSGQMTQRIVSLADYAGQDVYIAFHSMGTDGYLLAVDNVIVQSMQDNDAGALAAAANKYVETNTNNTVQVQVKNNGGNTITNLTIEWTDGTNVYSDTYSGLNIVPLATSVIDLTDPANFADVAEHNITVTITAVNGNADADTSNNVASFKTYTVSQAVERAVVVEEGTGTWCGYCPRGIVAMEYMYDNPSLFPNFIGIAVHNSDPMTVAAYDSGLGFSGFPGSAVNRLVSDIPVTQDIWTDYYNSFSALLPPADIELTAQYDNATRELVATVNSTFYTNISNADYRYALVVVEDDVSGTGEGWSQSNYYAGGQMGAMGGFENKPSSVSDIEYDRVARALIGGFAGEAGSVPAQITDGLAHSYDFTYTIPADINVEEASVVALLINNAGAIVNATELPLGDLGVNDLQVTNNFKLYPNPAVNYVNVSFAKALTGEVAMHIYDLNGRLVKTQNFNSIQANSALRINVSDLATGEYLLSFSTDKGSIVKKLVVK